jgi:hypothetical protein
VCGQTIAKITVISLMTMDSQETYDYDRLRSLLAARLEDAANAHDSGDLAAIANGFDEIDHALPRHRGSHDNILFIALNFWDGWIDARNHEWLYYKGISREDWGALARQIAYKLRNGLEIDNERVLHHFDLRIPPRKSLFTHIRDHIHKRSF